MLAAGPAPAPEHSIVGWKAQIVALLNRNKRFPADKVCASGTVQLRFAVDRRGEIVSSAIQASSGVAAFDAEALAMLARVGRFPPSPDPARAVTHCLMPISFDSVDDKRCPQS
jgi:protein TonB